jgi:hypothetical protein
MGMGKGVCFVCCVFSSSTEEIGWLWCLVCEGRFVVFVLSKWSGKGGKRIRFRLKVPGVHVWTRYCREESRQGFPGTYLSVGAVGGLYKLLEPIYNMIHLVLTSILLGDEATSRSITKTKDSECQCFYVDTNCMV